jgi:hypothetical protein
MKGISTRFAGFSSLGIALVVLLIVAFYAPIFQPIIFVSDNNPYGVNVENSKEQGCQGFQQEKTYITLSEPLIMSALVNGLFSIGISRRSTQKHTKFDNCLSACSKSGRMDGYYKNNGNFTHLSYLLRFYHPESNNSEADPA